MRNKIRLDTTSDVQQFLNAIEALPSSIQVTVSDNDGNFKVSGRSFLGLLYASAEFPELIVEADHDIYDKIVNFIAE